MNNMNNADLKLFLRNLWNQGVEFWLEDEQLSFRGNKNVVSGDTLSILRANKSALIDILKANPHAYLGFPLSHGQRAIQLMQSMSPESFAYNQACLLKLTDNLNVQVLENSLDFLLQRHAPLRMTIKNLDGYMAQQMSFSLPSILSYEEVSISNDTDWHKWISKEADRPFNLSTEPLIRAKLITSSNNLSGSNPQFHLLFVVHHIIADFWALELIIKEFETIYLSSLTDSTPQLPEIGKLYKDYVIYENDWLQSANGQAAKNYWKKRLTPLPPTLELPTDFPRPQRQSFKGQEYSFNLGFDLTSQLKKQAKFNHVTPFVWVLSCYQILLHRYTGENHIAIGSPVACRMQRDFQRLAGHFTNPVILLADFNHSKLFEMLLDENKEQLLQAMKYQEYPLQCLLEDLQPHRDANTNPLFQVAISWNQLQDTRDYSNGLIDDVVLMEQRGAIYDLVLTCYDKGDDIQLSWRFNSDIFKLSSIERLTDHLKNLLEKSCDAFDTHIGLWDFRTENEILVTKRINQTTSDYPQNINLAKIFQQQAKLFSNNLAFTFNNETRTYIELEQYSNQIANYLRSKGATANQHISLCLERSYDLLASILATLKLSCTYVPISLNYPEDRIAYINANTHSAFLISLTSHQNKLVSITKEQPYTSIIFLDQTATLIANSTNTFCLENDGQILFDDIACVIFTSGSTGNPKGVKVPHRAITRLSINNNYITIKPGEKFLHLSNITFDAVNIEIWNALLNGGCLACIDNDTLLDPKKFQLFISKENPRYAFITTTLFNMLINFKPDVFKHFFYLLVGGEALDIKHIRICLEQGKPQHLLNGYGPTENGSFSTCYEISSINENEKSIPIGSPISNSQVYIHDSNGLQTPFNVIGEIVVGGDGVATGYLNQPELTAKQFIPDHYLGENRLLYITGDTGYLREDGEIIYVGRKDDQVKIRGYRIELGEIEKCLATHSQIKQCCVIVNNLQTSPAIAAYFTSDITLDSTELKKFLRKTLPEFMIPNGFMQLKQLPINDNGKIAKKQLPPIIIESSNDFVAPRNINEEKIAHIWQTFLGLEKIGIYDNFFELGGHSLLAVKVANALQETLNIEMSMRLIFEHPNIADLCESLNSTNTITLPDIKKRVEIGPIPASLSQQRLWFLQQLAPDSKAYNMPIALRFSSSIKPSFAEQCIRTLLLRHEVLRTTFNDNNGVAYMHVNTIKNWKIPTLDLSQLNTKDAHKEASKQLNMLANHTFDLETGPLLKALFIRLTNKEHILAFCSHHIIVDGWSVELLFSELAQLIHLKHPHQDFQLPELPIQYSDFSSWQREWLQGDLLNRQLDYWKAQLAGANTLLNIPTDKPRPPILGTAGAKHHFSLPSETINRLKLISQYNGATLFMTLMTGYAILLARYSQQTDICIGFPISGRNHQALEPLIGLFVNNLVIRCNLTGSISANELIAQIKNTTIEAYQHQDVPFDLIIDSLKIERTLSYTPFLQASFALESKNIDEQIFEIFGSDVKLEPIEWNIAKYDINLTCYDSNTNAITATLEFNTDIYNLATIEQMASHFVQILNAMTENINAPIQELSILTSEERHKTILNDRSDQHKNKHLFLTTVTHFEIQASTFSKKKALTFGENSLTYKELNEHSNQLAHFLREKHIGAGAFVGLFIDRSIEMVIAIIGILKTGAAYIPLDPNSPTERINFIIADAAIEHLISTSNLSHKIEVSTIINLDVEIDSIKSAPKTNLNIHIPIEANAYVIYTSGTTGKPKGCLISHRNLTRLFTTTEPQFNFNEKDVWTLFHSYAFDFSVWEMWGALLYGGRLVIVPQWMSRTPDRFYDLLEAEKVTILNQTPSAFSQLISIDLAMDSTKNKPLALRKVIFGGEALDFSALQLWTQKHPLKNTQLINMYGITETTVHVTYHPISNDDLLLGRSIIGKPLNDLNIYLLDPNGQLVPKGVIGEIFISGEGVTKGYLHRDALTQERFLSNPFVNELPPSIAKSHTRLYRSGDLARRLHNGDIEYLGRIDHQVKIRGHRIELGEIEAVLNGLENIQESIVIAREDEPSNKRLVAYLLSENQQELDTLVIRQQLKSALPDYMIPSAFVLVTEWPLTENGKIDKQRLPAPTSLSLSSQNRESAYIAPRNHTELAISAIWSEILNVEKIGINDNFFELGGHSLLATQVASRIRSTLECNLELKAIFENPTVAELALIILEEEIDSLDMEESELLALLAEIDKDEEN